MGSVPIAYGAGWYSWHSVGEKESDSPTENQLSQPNPYLIQTGAIRCKASFALSLQVPGFRRLVDVQVQVNLPNADIAERKTAIMQVAAKCPVHETTCTLETVDITLSRKNGS
jgi:hypothetical protein